MVKLWMKMPNLVLVLVLVALIGCLDVLFGCCMNCNVEEDIALNDRHQIKEKQIRESSIGSDSNTNSGPFGRIRGYLPKTKMDIFNTVLFGFVLIFGFSLFISLISTNTKKDNIVQRAEMLEQSLQNPVSYRQEKIDFVQDLLCRPLPNSSEHSPLYSHTNHIGTTEVNTKQVDTKQVSTIQSDIFPISTTEVGLYQQSPSTTDVGFAVLPNRSECSRIALAITEILYPHIGDFYECVIGGYEIESQFQTVLNLIAAVDGDNCGAGFFLQKRMPGYDAIYFHGNNEFVADAINDITCEKAALATFPQLAKLNHNIHVTNYRHNFNDDIFIYEDVQNAIKIADGKFCGDGFIEFARQGSNQWRITYSSRNPHVAKVLPNFVVARPNTVCEKAAYDTGLMLASKNRFTNKVNAEKTMSDLYNLKPKLDAAAASIVDANCGTGFFSYIRHPSNDRYSIHWKGNNPFIVIARRKVFAKIKCMSTANSVAAHMKYIGLYSTASSGTLVIPDIGEDIEVMMAKTRQAGSMDCGRHFFEIVVNDSGNFALSYNTDNEYVELAMIGIRESDQCRLAARGVVRRLLQREKFTKNSKNNILITRPSWLVSELRWKINQASELDCGDGFPSYVNDDYRNGVIVSYSGTNGHVNAVATKQRQQVWCPQSARIFSFLLDRLGYSKNDNSETITLNLTYEYYQSLITDATTQLAGVDCGAGYYSVTVDEDFRATFSWGNGNTHVNKAWIFVNSNFAFIF